MFCKREESSLVRNRKEPAASTVSYLPPKKSAVSSPSPIATATGLIGALRLALINETWRHSAS